MHDSIEPHHNIESLCETFAAHEYLAPNAVEVLEKANARARSYRRRRRAAQATGASVLGAGIVAGSVALPGLKLHPSSTSGTPVAAAGVGSSVSASSAVPATPPASAATPSASPSPTYTQDQELSEYFADGFDYNNATALASLWHETDITKVKAKAGLLLLQGSTLPVTPNGTPESAAQKLQDQELNAYFAAGYNYNDALSLGALWNETDVLQIKVEAGQTLLAGQTLPIQPSVPSTVPTPTPNRSLGASVPDTAQAKAVAAYFAGGYNYDDAVSLGKLWNQADTYQIKIEAGQKLLDGQTLPIAP